MNIRSLSPMLLMLGALAAGCAANGNPDALDAGIAAAPTLGELRVALTDAPGPFDQILVDVTALDVHSATATDSAGDDAGSSSDGWTRVADVGQRIDLLTLQNGVQMALGSVMLPAGAYDQLRLIVSGGAVVAGGVSSPLTIPSGSETGVKVRYAFTLDADTTSTLTLDFDGAASIVDSGHGYLLRPVLSIRGASSTAMSGAAGGGSAHAAPDLGAVHPSRP